MHLLVAEGVEATAKSAVRLLQGADLGDRLRRAARAHVAEQFTWERAASTVEQVWLRAAGR